MPDLTMTRKDDQEKRRLISTTKAFGFGLIAGLAMVLVTILFRFVFDALSITELAADWFTGLLPGAILDFLLETLVFSAKPLMFAGLLIGQVIMGGLFGILYSLVDSRFPADDSQTRIRAILFGLILWLIFMFTLVPAFGGGFFGSQVPGGTLLFLLSSLVAFAVYGLTFGVLFARGSSQSLDQVYDTGRRGFLVNLGILAAIGGLVILGVQFAIDRFGGRLSPSGATRTQGVLSTEVTPNDEFYIVSKNIVDPQVSPAQWQLSIGGMVESPFTMGFQELRDMPFIEEFVTLECISNRVGGNLIGNAEWKGVPLKSILEMSGVRPNIVDISFKAWDGYTESIRAEMAMRDEVIVAYEMNGEPLSHKHGFPARLIIPGFFGLKSVKWLTAIEPVAYDFRGYWQERGWTDVPHVKTFSRFDIPQNRAVAFGDSIMLGGVAFAGIRGIASVEVSDNAGQTWTPVDYVSEPISPYTWVIWTTEFLPSGPGAFNLRVRATDGEGSIQTSELRPTLPDGASGHHEIQFELRSRSG